MEDVRVTRLINGPEAFTPDGEFCLGETAVRGLFVAAGFCAHGLAGAGGIGKVMAEWIVEGEPSLDLWHMDIRRFGEPLPLAALHAGPHARGLRDLLRHQVPQPRAAGGAAAADSRPRTRGTRAHGAVFGEKAGWERVNWYEANAAAGDESLRPRGWAGMPLVAGDRRRAPRLPRGRRAVRRVLVRQARGLRARTRRSSSSGCPRTGSRARSGRVTYTQMLNRRGGIECDFTVTRLDEERFGIVTGTAFGNHDLAWIRSHLPAAGSADVRVADVTSQWACFALWGPRARATCCRLHDRGPDHRRVPVHDVPRRSTSATCRCARCA